MDKLIPVFWILGVVLAYAGVAGWIVSVRHAFRSRTHVGGWILVVLAIALPLFMLNRMGVGALSLTLSGLVGIAILAIFYRIVPVKQGDQHKAVRESMRQTFLHLVLITGSIIFMVPFVWLVSTSLKDDEDIFTEKIRIIPRRPVEQQIQGKWYFLVNVEGADNLPGQRAGVWARIQDKEESVRVAPVMDNNTLGPETEVSPEVVSKVKEPGAVWENYPNAMAYLPEETKKGLVYLNNTLLVTLFSIVGTLLTASMVAYAFGRLRWPGRDGLFLLLLSTMMLPYAVIMIPQFLIWQRLGFVDTLVPLWAGAFLGGGAFNVFLLRQFFKTIPTELEEAAKIDGCGYWRTFSTVMLPLVRPALATVAIMTFMGSWNNFMGPLIYISSPTKMPLAYALQLFQTVHGGEFGYLMAASTMVMIPVLVVFFFCQRYFIQGITMTGLKG